VVQGVTKVFVETEQPVLCHNHDEAPPLNQTNKITFVDHSRYSPDVCNRSGNNLAVGISGDFNMTDGEAVLLDSGCVCLIGARLYHAFQR
jgi:hypothetical protein